MGRITIAFSDVGRGHLSWRAEVPRPLTHHGLMREIRKHKALLSQDVEFHENGKIYVGGIRPVGNWQVIEEPKSVDAVDPSAADSGTPAPREKASS